MRFDLSTVEGSLKTLGCYVYTEEKEGKADSRFAMTDGRKFTVGLKGAGHALLIAAKIIINIVAFAFYTLLQNQNRVEELKSELADQGACLTTYCLIAGFDQKQGLNALPLILLQSDPRYKSMSFPQAIAQFAPSGLDLLKGLGGTVFNNPSEKVMLYYGVRSVIAWIKNNEVNSSLYRVNG